MSALVSEPPTTQTQLVQPKPTKRANLLNNYFGPLKFPKLSLVPKTEKGEKAEFEALWKKLDCLIQNIFKPMEQRTPVLKEEYMYLYTKIHNICSEAQPTGNHRSAGRYNNAELKLPKELYTRLESHFKKHIKQIESQGTDLQDNKQVLLFYSKQCHDFCSSSKILNGLCQYLNRSWIADEKLAKQNTVQDIYHVALLCWRENLFESLNKKATESILDIILRDRIAGKKECDNAQEIREVIQSYIVIGRFGENASCNSAHADKTTGGENLSVYRESFEKKFLAATRNFYAIRVGSIINRDDPTGTILKIEDIINAEEGRVEKLFHISSKPKVALECIQTLVIDNQAILNSAFQQILAERKLNELRGYYKIIRRISQEAITTMANQFQRYVAEIAQNELSVLRQGPELFCESVMKFINSYKAIVRELFEDSIEFKKALDKACESFLNPGESQGESTLSKIPGFLAKYSDIVLKKSKHVKAEEELEEIQIQAKLKDILFLLNFVRDKDLFQKYTQHFLGNRLITESSVSHDETNFIESLKSPCGRDFVRLLVTMYQDTVNVSKTHQDAFKDANPNVNFSFNVYILAADSWNITISQQLEEFIFPQDIQDAMTKYVTFYSNRHKSRKVTWVAGRSSGEITYHKPSPGPPKKYVLLVSTFEMAILLLFNKKDQYTMKEFQSETKLELDFLVAVVQNLVNANLLKIVGDNNNANEKMCIGGGDCKRCDGDSVIALDESYRNSNTRIKLNLPVRNQTAQEEAKLDGDIKRAREFTLQAVIVKVMKSKQKLRYQNLIGEAAKVCQENYKYFPDVGTIRTQIDILADKDYVVLKDGMVTYVA